MRIRTVKPAFFKDDEISELEPLARILFIGLWCMADCDGRLEDRPKIIKVEILPYDDVEINGLLEKLHGGGFIHRYAAGDGRYIQVVNFKKHQRISGQEADQKSEFPAPGTQREAPVKHP